jgi:hypothetical protein
VKSGCDDAIVIRLVDARVKRRRPRSAALRQEAVNEFGAVRESYRRTTRIATRGTRTSRAFAEA